MGQHSLEILTQEETLIAFMRMMMRTPSDQIGFILARRLYQTKL